MALCCAGERLFSSIMPVRRYDWEESFRFRWAEVPHNVAAASPAFENVTSFLLWDAALKVYGGTFVGGYIPYPSSAAVQRGVDTVHRAGKTAMIYMSAGWRNARNATEYIEGVKEWQTKYGIDGVYSDGLPQDDFLVAYEIVRMLRELFPSGPLVFHDTLDGYPSTFRPFLHSYATATLMAEGVVNTDGLGWQWPRYAVSAFRKSNAFGGCKCTGWRGPGISAPAPADSYELAQLVYGGRQRQSQTSAAYDSVLDELETVWREHGQAAGGTFYDKYYLPVAQNATGLRIGRSPMPIATTIGGTNVKLSVFAASTSAQIRYTVDGSAPSRSSTVYTSTLALAAGTQLRAVSDTSGLDLSRELTMQIDKPGTSTPRRLTDDPEAVAPSCAGFGAVPGYTCYTATCAGPPNPTGACGLPILQPAAGHPLPTAQQCTAKDDRAACVRALAAACNGTASCESFSAEQDGSVRLFAGAGVTANSGWTTVRLPPLVACEEGSCI